MPLRYLANFDINHLKKEICDVIIVGSGVAGLYSAINLDKSKKVFIISKESMDENNSYLAQGGIAAAVGEGDLPEYHFEDTIKAGAGQCDNEAVSILVEQAPGDVENLCNIGTNFDRNPDGTLTTTREGGHRRFRIIHALGDATGRELVDSLLRECRRRDNITIIENCFAMDIATVKGRYAGLLVQHENEYKFVMSKAIIFASGGIGQVYKNTTNATVITGDGIAMTYRAGAELTDMEFVQFHPTAMYSENVEENKFLISEAVRGEGGILRNTEGKRFMPEYHEMAEVAPRDIVARAIFAEMKKTQSNFVYLDVTHKEPEHIKKRFPNIYGHCLEKGIDITKQFIPVCPVQHYFMGGIKTDLWGRTNIQGVYACGEAANTGVHGANRLASNSLLEGLVFGRRCAEEINATINQMKAAMPDIVNERHATATVDAEAIKESIKKLMNDHAGIERNEKDMTMALSQINEFIEQLENSSLEMAAAMETINIAYIAALILKSAIRRKESVGSHYRIDR
ncbi:MAG: nadB [Clostridia bacterium]|jgi:L-aspartate oxidase|nr:nadB [Clostridia bacterium]